MIINPYIFRSIQNKVVYGFSDTNYFQAPTNVYGGGVTGTKRMVFRVESVPTTGQKVIVGKTNSGTGWYIQTGVSVTNEIAVIMNGGSVKSAGFPILSGHIGQSFVLHFSNNGTYLKMYINGLQVGSSVTSTGSPNPISMALFTIGTAQPLLTLFNNHIGVLNYNETASVLIDSEIDADATNILNQTGYITYPAMNSSIHNLVADDLTSGSNWADKISGTLNVFGSPTIANI